MNSVKKQTVTYAIYSPGDCGYLCEVEGGVRWEFNVKRAKQFASIAEADGYYRSHRLPPCGLSEHDQEAGTVEAIDPAVISISR